MKWGVWWFLIRPPEALPMYKGFSNLSAFLFKRCQLTFQDEKWSNRNRKKTVFCNHVTLPPFSPKKYIDAGNIFFSAGICLKNLHLILGFCKFIGYHKNAYIQTVTNSTCLPSYLIQRDSELHLNPLPVIHRSSVDTDIRSGINSYTLLPYWFIFIFPLSYTISMHLIFDYLRNSSKSSSS